VGELPRELEDPHGGERGHPDPAAPTVALGVAVLVGSRPSCSAVCRCRPRLAVVGEEDGWGLGRRRGWEGALLQNIENVTQCCNTSINVLPENSIGTQNYVFQASL
jgi:hypothetical protein